MHGDKVNNILRNANSELILDLKYAVNWCNYKLNRLPKSKFLKNNIKIRMLYDARHIVKKIGVCHWKLSLLEKTDNLVRNSLELYKDQSVLQDEKVLPIM